LLPYRFLAATVDHEATLVLEMGAPEGPFFASIDEDFQE
jgi:hypothetical protein